jgi:hypothetical protein
VNQNHEFGETPRSCVDASHIRSRWRCRRTHSAFDETSEIQYTRSAAFIFTVWHNKVDNAMLDHKYAIKFLQFFGGRIPDRYTHGNIHSYFRGGGPEKDSPQWYQG